MLAVTTWILAAGAALTDTPATGCRAALVDLDLHRNQITSVPASIGDLTNLMSLFLSYNSITTLPAEISQLTSLKRLRLSFNDLTGVPVAFRTFSPTTECGLKNNPGFSCANIAILSSCCTTDNCGGDTSTCYTA